MAKSKIIPLGDRVLVSPEKENTQKSPSGIIIPQGTDEEKPKRGTVLAIGTLEDVTTVSVGDTVLFSDYGYDEVSVDKETLYIIQSKNLLAVIK